MLYLYYCLTCAGTGKRGNLSGKKKCKTCGGTGQRYVEPPEVERLRTICDGTYTILVLPGKYPELHTKLFEAEAPNAAAQRLVESIVFDLKKEEK